MTGSYAPIRGAGAAVLSRSTEVLWEADRDSEETSTPIAGWIAQFPTRKGDEPIRIKGGRGQFVAPEPR